MQIVNVSNLKEYLEELGVEDVVLLDGFTESFTGISNDNRAIYSYDLMIEEVMQRDNCTFEEAVDFIDFNTIRSLPYVKNSPIICYDVGF